MIPSEYGRNMEEIRKMNINTLAEEVNLLLWNAKRVEIFDPWDNTEYK